MAGMVRAAAALGLALLAAACAYPTRNQPLTAASAERRYGWTSPESGDALPETLVIVTASGGGTRATALALSVLRGMDKVRLPAGESLADEVDLISSVSGGSVTAAYFAMTGSAGLDRLEHHFVRRDGMKALVLDGLNPVGLAALATPGKERIDLLIDYLDRTLFEHRTFGYFLDAPPLPPRVRRPYLILNAADMVAGIPFPFTQDTMDLLCSDLTSLPIATAVAASAAFPVALSPVTLKNYSFTDAAGRPACGGPRAIKWVDLAAKTGWYTNPSRAALGRTAATYADGTTAYVHLLDGGIADNLGVSEPYRLLTTTGVSPAFLTQIQKGAVTKIIFIMIDARSAAPSRLGGAADTPGMLAMLLASINTSIDRASFGTAERARTLFQTEFAALAAEAGDNEMPDLAARYRALAAHAKFIAVEFDAIQDAACRRLYQSISTSWTLTAPQIDATLDIGQALLFDNPQLSAALAMIGATRPEGTPTVAEICAGLPDGAW